MQTVSAMNGYNIYDNNNVRDQLNETRATCEQIVQTGINSISGQVGVGMAALDNKIQGLNHELDQRVENAIADTYDQYENRMRQAALNAAQQKAHARYAAKQQMIINTHNLKMAEIAAKKDAAKEVAKIHSKASIKNTKILWKNVGNLFKSAGNGIVDFTKDGDRMLKVGTFVVASAAGIYATKYGIPVLISHLVQPRVVSETSKKSWFGYKAPTQQIAMSDLTFAPELQSQLLDIADRVQTAQLYNENLPNVMFYGAPGTGKTAFAKALALCSGLDYALTSGSEFAKITDLNLQNKELRKLLDWGMASDKGLIIFIDEAESLFANRKLPTTSKNVQDFINTFLALIPEKSQKNLMFIFATNHPFKLDDAITNRVGISVEFTLPQAPERTKILTTYLEKFAHENPDALVTFDPVVQKNLARYGEALEGLAPRAIKYVAEEMVVYARRQKNRQLSDELARHAIKSAITSIQQTEHWATERDKWIKAQTATA